MWWHGRLWSSRDRMALTSSDARIRIVPSGLVTATTSFVALHFLVASGQVEATPIETVAAVASQVWIHTVARPTSTTTNHTNESRITRYEMTSMFNRTSSSLLGRRHR